MIVIVIVIGDVNVIVIVIGDVNVHEVRHGRTTALSGHPLTRDIAYGPRTLPSMA